MSPTSLVFLFFIVHSYCPAVCNRLRYILFTFFLGNYALFFISIISACFFTNVIVQDNYFRSSIGCPTSQVFRECTTEQAVFIWKQQVVVGSMTWQKTGIHERSEVRKADPVHGWFSTITTGMYTQVSQYSIIILCYFS